MCNRTDSLSRQSLAPTFERCSYSAFWLPVAYTLVSLLVSLPSWFIAPRRLLIHFAHLGLKSWAGDASRRARTLNAGTTSGSVLPN